MCCIDGQKNKYSVLNECNRMLKYNICDFFHISCCYMKCFLQMYIILPLLKLSLCMEFVAMNIVTYTPGTRQQPLNRSQYNGCCIATTKHAILQHPLLGNKLCLQQEKNSNHCFLRGHPREVI
jgi:hypothetical protein